MAGLLLLVFLTLLLLAAALSDESVTDLPTEHREEVVEGNPEIAFDNSNNEAPESALQGGDVEENIAIPEVTIEPSAKQKKVKKTSSPSNESPISEVPDEELPVFDSSSEPTSKPQKVKKTARPTLNLTLKPTRRPTSAKPTRRPSTLRPTRLPTSAKPTHRPSTFQPTRPSPSKTFEDVKYCLFGNDSPLQILHRADEKKLLLVVSDCSKGSIVKPIADAEDFIRKYDSISTSFRASVSIFLDGRHECFCDDFSFSTWDHQHSQLSNCGSDDVKKCAIGNSQKVPAWQKYKIRVKVTAFLDDKHSHVMHSSYTDLSDFAWPNSLLSIIAIFGLVSTVGIGIWWKYRKDGRYSGYQSIPDDERVGLMMLSNPNGSL